MRLYKLGVHKKTDLKVHLIWILKYRKKVLTGPVATRARDILRQIALEHEIERWRVKFFAHFEAVASIWLSGGDEKQPFNLLRGGHPAWRQAGMKESVPQKLSNVIQIDETRIRDHLGELVRDTVEETLNQLLDAEAEYNSPQKRDSVLRWIQSPSWAK